MRMHRVSDAYAKNIGSHNTGRDHMGRPTKSMLESGMKQLFRMARERKGEKKRKRLCTSSLELTSAWQALYIKSHIERLTGIYGVC